MGAAPLQPANALGGPQALQGALPAHLQQLLATQIAQVVQPEIRADARGLQGLIMC